MADPNVTGGLPAEWTTMEAMVNAPDLRPFVQITSGVGNEPTWASKQPPSVTTALGLRAIQAAIEAERDAAMIVFIRDEFGPQCGLDEQQSLGMAAHFLDGLRRHRQQFDAAAGSSTTALADDDPSRPQ
jgi:hypothetical protein